MVEEAEVSNQPAGRELDRLVAEALGLKPPQDSNEIRLSAHTWLPAGYSVWPPRWSESADLALEAWRQARAEQNLYLVVAVSPDGRAFAHIQGQSDDVPWRYGESKSNEPVATAICRAIVEW